MAPIIAAYWERAEFPFELVPKLAKLGLSGATLKGNGCPGQSILAAVSTCCSTTCPALSRSRALASDACPRTALRRKLCQEANFAPPDVVGPSGLRFLFRF